MQAGRTHTGRDQSCLAFPVLMQRRYKLPPFSALNSFQKGYGIDSDGARKFRSGKNKIRKIDRTVRVVVLQQGGSIFSSECVGKSRHLTSQAFHTAGCTRKRFQSNTFYFIRSDTIKPNIRQYFVHTDLKPCV